MNHLVALFFCDVIRPLYCAAHLQTLPGVWERSHTNWERELWIIRKQLWDIESRCYCMHFNWAAVLCHITRITYHILSLYFSSHDDDKWMVNKIAPTLTTMCDKKSCEFTFAGVLTHSLMVRSCADDVDWLEKHHLMTKSSGFWSALDPLVSSMNFQCVLDWCLL